MKRGIGQRSRKFIRELKDFVQAQDGRGAALAKYLKVRPVTVYNWWSGKRFPTLEHALGAMEWMKQERGE
jgi:transcriptional regulator with XRE-family HTH domain